MVKHTNDIKIPIWDERMLDLMQLKLSDKTVATEKEFLKSIGFTSSNNLKQLKEGRQSFRHQHLLNAALAFNISMDWFYGLTNQKTNNKEASGPLELLSEAIFILKKNETAINKAINISKNKK